MSERKKIGVIGAGISGLSAAWLLSRRHEVTLYEADTRLGGHAHTVTADGAAVDTGFIVYNEPNYPNLTDLFRHLEVETAGTQTAQQFDETVRDLTAFLQYAAEPAVLQRQKLGVWVVLYLAFFTFLAWLLKKEYWKDVH